MKKLTSILLAALGAVALVSCNNEKPSDKPTPPSPPPVDVELNNAITYQKDTIALRSIVLDQSYIKDMITIAVSADEGLTTIEQIIAKNESDQYIHKPILIVISKDSFNDSIDVMDPQSATFSFTNFSTMCNKISFVANETTDEVKSGLLKFTLKGEDLTIDYALTPKEGTDLFEGNIKTKYAPEPIPTTNILTLDGKVSAVKSQFFAVGEYETSVYLTPSRISSSTMLTNVATYYMKLKVSNYIGNNTKVDITKADEEFELEYYYPLTEEKVVIKYGELPDATTGWFQLNKKGDGTYAVDFDITMGERTFKCQFDGTFTKYEIPNEYTVNGATPTPIKSVVVDKKAGADGRWDIYLSHVENLTTVEQMKSSGDPVTLVFNQNYLGTGIIGFFDHEDIAIIYKNITYNNASNKAGNIKGNLVDSDIKLDFTIFSFEAGDLSMSGHYEGPYTTIE